MAPKAMKTMKARKKGPRLFNGVPQHDPTPFVGDTHVIFERSTSNVVNGRVDGKGRSTLYLKGAAKGPWTEEELGAECAKVHATCYRELFK